MKSVRWKRWALLLLAPLVVLVVVLAVNTIRKSSLQLHVSPLQRIEVDEAVVARRLSVAIQARTVAHRDRADMSADQFLLLHEHLRKSYPRVHALARREVISDFSLLYSLPGSDSSAKPILLMAHQDVVPVSFASRKDWVHEPFSGTIADGFVWGRGAWDNKGNLVAQLEALEMLLANGFQPRRTIYLAFGADEEVGGLRGAAQIAKLLADRGVRLEFVLDEGLVVTDGVIPGVGKPVAMIGVAEKGSIALDLSVKVEAGHSSMPPPSSGTGAVAVLGEAMRRLDDRQMPAQLRGVARDMFETLAPEMRGLNRIVLSNLWLFGPMVKAQLQRAATTNAMLRTTSALTMVRAGDAENVMPGQADGIVSFRVAPGDTVRSVLDHVQETIDDARVSIQARPGAAEASPVSATSSTGYSLINRSVREVLPDAVVVPGLLIGGTDARHFSAISDDVFRFSPIRTRPEDLSRFHGVNERISVENLVELVRFYHRFIDLAAGPAL